jgi:diguanylate cyclase (GGDEF)-like protein
MPIEKSELEKIFYPVIDEIYSNPSNQTSWVAVLVDGGRKNPVWVYSCKEAWRGATNGQDIDVKEKLEVFRTLAWYSKLYRDKSMEPFSQLIFAETTISQPIIFTTASTLKSDHKIIAIDFLRRFRDFIPTDFSVLKFKENRPEMHRRINAISRKIMKENEDSVVSFVDKLQTELGVRRNIDPEKLVHFMIWLYLHDPDGKYWIYFPCSRRQGRTNLWGGVMVCQKSLPSDRKLIEYQDLTSLCFELCAYDPCFHSGKPGFTEALSRAMWVSDKMFLQHRKEIEACIRNFETKELRERLIELERMMILKPLSWASFFKPNIRWISAFGWHTLTNDLYRIGWDFCPGKIPKKPGAWRNAEKSKKRFGILAGLFEELLGRQEIFSIGDLLFAKCNRKRPIVISYDLDRANLLYDEGLASLADEGDFIFSSIRSFYDPIKERLQEIPVDEMMTPDGFKEKINEYLGKFVITTLSALDQDVFSELEKLEPRITREERQTILRRMTLYFPWLILHDLKTRLVVYFPSLIKPDIPSGGVMIGFKRPPSAHELICLQEYVTKIFLVRSYLLSELVPEFPEILTEAPFTRKVDSMLQESRDTKSVTSFAYIDLDDLKKINEEYGGHTAGTLALKALITVLKEKMASKADVDQWAFARYGGDEFMLAVFGMKSRDLGNLLSEVRATLKNKEALQKLLKKELERYEKTHGALQHFDRRKFLGLSQLTFSAGIASSAHHADYVELRQSADNAEDLAKKAGKDRIEFCSCGCA